MAINDILTQVDLLPGLSENRQQDIAPQSRDGRNSNSEYHRALSRTLSRADRREQTTVDRPETADARQPPTASEGRRSQPSENARPARADAKTERPALKQDAGETPVTKVDNNSNSKPLQNDAKSEQTDASESTAAVAEADSSLPLDSAPVVDVLAGSDETPRPPADLSLLFATLSSDDAPAAVTDLETETGADDEPPLPPNGLFESLETVGGQRGNPLASPSNQPSTPSGSTPENANSDVAALRPQQDVVGEFRQPLDAEPQRETQPGANRSPDALSAGLKSVTADTALETELLSHSAANDQTVGESVDDPSLSSAKTPQELAASVAANLPIAATERGHDGSRNGERHRADPIQAVDTVAPSRGTTSADESTNQPPISTGRNTDLLKTTAVVQMADLESPNESTGGGDSSKVPTSPAGDQLSAASITPREVQSTASPQGTAAVDPEQFVERVAVAVRSAPQNGQQLRIRLDPPHLGPLQIEVTSRNGTLSVRMEVQTVAAHSTLLDNMSALRDALVQQGASLDRIDVQLVETTAEEGRADLTDEQQQQREQQQQTAEEQSDVENQQQPVKPGTEQNPKPLPTGNGINELDIQV